MPISCQLYSQFYSASFTGDVRQAFRVVEQRFPGCPLVGVGWSLGANILLRRTPLFLFFVFLLFSPLFSLSASPAARSWAWGGVSVKFNHIGQIDAKCRYLGEEGAGARLAAAVSLCNPFHLPLADAHFQRGFNRIYDWRAPRRKKKPKKQNKKAV